MSEDKLAVEYAEKFATVMARIAERCIDFLEKPVPDGRPEAEWEPAIVVNDKQFAVAAIAMAYAKLMPEIMPMFVLTCMEFNDDAAEQPK